MIEIKTGTVAKSLLAMRKTVAKVEPLTPVSGDIVYEDIKDLVIEAGFPYPDEATRTYADHLLHDDAAELMSEVIETLNRFAYSMISSSTENLFVDYEFKRGDFSVTLTEKPVTIDELFGSKHNLQSYALNKVIEKSIYGHFEETLRYLDDTVMTLHSRDFTVPVHQLETANLVVRDLSEVIDLNIALNKARRRRNQLISLAVA